MSTTKCEVCKILRIDDHSNADNLEVAIVQGWQTCVRKGTYKVGDRVVYFEPGTALSKETVDRLGISGYLSEKMNIDGDRVLVVSQIKLRGESSFGLVVPAESEMIIGANVADYYGATKYDPPTKCSTTDAAIDHILFPAYTNLENLRSYPDALIVGEEVVVSEKIHGCNCRVGYVQQGGDLIAMAGSRRLRRIQPKFHDLATNIYWHPHTLPAVQDLFCCLQDNGHNSAVLYGEVYGKQIQSYTYGENKLGFRAFDLLLDSVFVDHDFFKVLCDKFGVETAPLLYRGNFSLNIIKDLSNGKSFVGGDLGREGVVVKPIVERTWQNGRLILKYVGDDYLLGKAAKFDTTDL